ncbi:DASH family cryptochrome [Xylariaceae sp. FL0594]|nr:DASH family cryptochrome [Xylariaceae sp. FL0594]
MNKMPEPGVLIYILRHDLRITDNPILHHLASNPDHGFTHLLPLYVVPPHQVEVSGFLKEGEQSPYPEARSEVGRFWRCGPHRARFFAQSVWNLKENFSSLGNDLTIRIGKPAEVVKGLVEGLRQFQREVSAVWMVSEEGYEEAQDEKEVAETCSTLGINFQPWVDEKYLIDDRDVKIENPQALPDVFTTYRKMNEPLRERPRPTKPRPSPGSLPDPVETEQIPSQMGPFEIPPSLDAFEAALLRPIQAEVPDVPPVDENKSAHPFRGGEDDAFKRLVYLIKSGNALLYKSSRNGLLGVDYSTKLSAYLAQGCITARQIHEELLHFEDGTDQQYAETEGFGKGENEGTAAIRFELLWRDYMRLCTRRFRGKLFLRSGFRDDHLHKWKTARADDKSAKSQQQPVDEVSALLKRVLEGTTGQSLIDASQRELIHTGYTSNRARQNVGSFVAKHLNIDWRYGAEWYEFLLVDYDVNSNWANWQYVSGVGNDPRGEARIFNPVKQAFDYDKEGDYVRCWLPELQKIERLENLFQPCTTPKEDWERFGLTGLPMAADPVKKIDFTIERKPKSSRRPYGRRRGQGRGESNHHSSPTSLPSPDGEDGGVKEAPVAPRREPQPKREMPFNARGNYRGGRGFGAPFRGRGRGPGRAFPGRGGRQQFAPQEKSTFASHPPYPWAQPSGPAQ